MTFCAACPCCLPSSGTKELDLELEILSSTLEICPARPWLRQSRLQGVCENLFEPTTDSPPHSALEAQELLLEHQPPLSAAASLRWARLGSALQLCLEAVSVP